MKLYTKYKPKQEIPFIGFEFNSCCPIIASLVWGDYVMLYIFFNTELT